MRGQARANGARDISALSLEALWRICGCISNVLMDALVRAWPLHSAPPPRGTHVQVNNRILDELEGVIPSRAFCVLEWPQGQLMARGS